MQRIALSLCLLAACLAGSASAQRSYGNFMAAMNAQPQFNTIKQAINFLSLAPTFSNPQLKVTVFAPTDSAFAAARKRFPTITESVIMSNKGILQQVVYYHIAREVVAAPLPAGKQMATYLQGKSLTGNGMTVQGVSSSAKIVDPNVKCGAGIAHGIDNVLLFTQLPASLGR